MTDILEQDMTCGQALVKLLEAYDVDTVFGIPGVHTLELYRGLPGRDIRHVLTRHEQGAGFMADGYARVSGKPGVCFIITGPGLTNIATPIGQAYADSIPMLVITSVNETASLGKGWGRLHETQDQRAISAPLTAFSATAYQSSDIPDLIARAFSVFNSERPRPVHIEIPLDVLAAKVDTDWTSDVRLTASRPAPQPAAIKDAVELLNAAEKPVIIAGGGAIEAGELIQELAEKVGAAVFTTVAGKGLLPEGHDLNAGSILCVKPTWDYLSQADVVLAIGSELSDTDMWCDKLPLNGKIIRVDIDPGKMSDLYSADVAIVADAGAAASALAAEVKTVGAVRQKVDGVLQQLQQLKSAVSAEQGPLQQKHIKVLDLLRRTMPSNTFVATDMTQIAYTGNYSFPVEQVRSWFHPTGYGTLGYGLPAGIGAKIGAPDRPGVVLSGDGGLLYTVQELATATEELDAPFVVILWNNDSLGQIRDDMVSLDIPEIGVSPKNPNFMMLAESFGCRTAQPDSLAALEVGLQEAFEYNGVTFIEMHERFVDV